MTTKAEYEAAYFTLLRAREERDYLLRYAEFLEAEQDRLDRFSAQVQESQEQLPRKMIRPIAGTTKALLEAVGRRRSAVMDERRRMPERLSNADAFVAECELEVETLRR